MNAGKWALLALGCVWTAQAAPALADTLIDNVRGISFDTEGRAERFTGLVIGQDGRIAQVLGLYDARPARPQYAVNGKGAVLIPGLVISHMRVMDIALAAITAPEAMGRPLPPPRPEDRDLALAVLQPQLLARGITTVGDMGTTIEDWQSYRRAGDAGRLSLRLIGYAAGTANMVLIGGPGPSPWLYEGRLRLAGLYINADVAPPVRPNPIQLKNMMSRAAMDRFQVVVRLAPPAQPIPLAAKPVQPAKAHLAKPQPAKAKPAPVLQREDVAAAIAELSQTYQGDRRWRVQDGAEPGLSLPEPLAQLAEGNRAAQLASLTAAAAYDLFGETQFGQIAVGRWADFVLLDADPLGHANPKVLESWVGGRRAYAAGDTPPVPNKP